MIGVFLTCSPASIQPLCFSSLESDTHLVNRDDRIFNANSFVGAADTELSSLAPLYQCCQLRRNFHSHLLQRSEQDVAALVNDQCIQVDIFAVHQPFCRLSTLAQPKLSDTQSEALATRIFNVLRIVQSCVDTHGAAYVFLNDDF